ncbi:MAG: alanine--tRNA ligase [Deltaproteobacteria bacterium]|nr:alanine--tRNA ligase [Deltaproteobacteria bacterium]
MKRFAKTIRQEFLDYFAKNGHTIVKSSSLIPANDPTLMFANAGMVQFKDVFVGAEQRPYTRAASCQKCLRVSGKHNDLEEVGRTARHHTFFEMLGNFSFGDYFKPEAIELAWSLITKEWGLNPERLWVTVFGGADGIAADTQARTYWKKISTLPEARILDMGMKDNFWAMGDTGPCGPCTEIHYDLIGNSDVSAEDFENGRIVEIWNNVFMQFERFGDGRMQPLQKTGVDTGMGLERITAIINQENSNYHSDLFMPLIEAVANICGKNYTHSNSEDDVSMRVIADHARTTAFLTADGVQPTNEGRGYVMRRIMRRAIRHGKRLGLDNLFFARICDDVVENMGETYPELNETRALISKVADLEERSFRRTLDTGLRILADEVNQAELHQQSKLSGEVVFKLYDTYGFPKDLTDVILAERGLISDDEGFAKEMAAQKERSRGSDVGEAAISDIYKELKKKLGEIEFIGYLHETEPLDKRDGVWRWHHDSNTEYLETECKVIALVKDGIEIKKIEHQANAEQQVFDLLISPTPFYAESGGQVGDTGIANNDAGFTALVLDTVKPIDGLPICKVRLLQGAIAVGDKIWAGYNANNRKNTRAHHSATHLLHGALRKVLGEHVKQSGSLVDAQHLRFDYSHFEAPTREQLALIEDDANAWVTLNNDIVTEVLPFDKAKQKGAIAFFGDKYGDIVRVISIGASVEFCGGTHARNTSDIGLIIITREESVASGVRRIEAQVGFAARATIREMSQRLNTAYDILTQKMNKPNDIQNPILTSIIKTVRHAQELSATISDSGGSPTKANTSIANPISLPDEFTLVQARQVRDLWHGLQLLVNARASEVDDVLSHYRAQDTGLLAAFAALLTSNKENERLIEENKRAALSSSTADLVQQARVINEITVLTARIDDTEAKSLRELADRLRQQLGSAILALGGSSEGKTTLLVAITPDLTKRFHAGKLIGQLSQIIGGKGGGKPDFAQAGGNKPEALTEAFATLEKLIGEA